ncbi:hypothetical protein [Oleiagrimonas soli]|uniref:Type IV secretory pathway VirB2 component (Pilin) n=1 Tax=Oleiagrimonas soli TaxID=1543381 RepID=A0A099CYY9_9GAMM|nr:hypothetical protein [Oleiagrimonas soli]KGI78245.1 hypothetical protein LF63_0107930 [Oleiagrimonas soli]MBB6183284.1 type IV secretory pathway VirB2 component (pilin) [Oleiagrimonas soli]
MNLSVSNISNSVSSLAYRVGSNRFAVGLALLAATGTSFAQSDPTTDILAKITEYGGYAVTICVAWVVAKIAARAVGLLKPKG